MATQGNIREDEINGSYSVVIAFTLSLFQRILNPWERIVFAAIGIACCLFGVTAILFASGGVERFVIGLISVLPVLIVRRSVCSLYIQLSNNDYINTAEIGQNAVAFGIDGLQAKLLPPYKAVRGLCRTLVVRNPYGSSIVVPSDRISLAKLRLLLSSREGEIG